MKAAILALLTLLVLPNIALAQHYCDTTPPTSGTVTVGTQPIQACLPAIWTPTSWKVYIDGAGGATITMTTDGTVSVSGAKLYKGTVQVLQGTHTYQVTASNGAGESPKSLPPFSLVANPVLTAPTSPDRVKVG